MKLEQVRPAVVRATLQAAELGSLVAAARWAAGGGKGDLPAEARAQLEDVLRSYDTEVARLNRAGAPSARRGE